MADTINLKVKLSAYTKGIIPDYSNFVTEAPNDGKIYARKDKEWVDIKDEYQGYKVVVGENSGLDIKHIDNATDELSIRQWVGLESELPSILESDKTYYTIDNTLPNYYLLGGTAYSEEEESFEQIMQGGTAITRNFDITLQAMNSRGEY